MKTKIEVSQRARPAIISRGTRYEQRALFYGFTENGQARVELESGVIAVWDSQEVELLDSKQEFKKWYWEGMNT